MGLFQDRVKLSILRGIDMKKKLAVIVSVVLSVAILTTGCTKGEVKVEEKPKEINNLSTESKHVKRDGVLKNIKGKGIGKRVRNIKPIRKIAIGKDFIIDGIDIDLGIDVNDPGAKSQWAVSSTNSNLVWDKIDQKEQVKVAVIDSGVDYNHPDLKGKIDVKNGYDFVNDDNDPMDDNGHGTHVAGIIAANMNNDEGIVGITGDLDVSILPIKAMDKDGSGDLNNVTKGIIYAVDKGVDIINLSLGGVDDDDNLKEAIEYAIEKNVLVIAAAGNDKRNCDNYTPAGIEGVYTVGASSIINKMARFSNFGTSIDIAAPGISILSTVPGGGYEAWDGTSMAAPVVTGVAAMLIAEDNTITVNEIKTILDETAKDMLKDGYDILSGNGFIDSLKAFEKLKN